MNQSNASNKKVARPNQTTKIVLIVVGLLLTMACSAVLVISEFLNVSQDPKDLLLACLKPFLFVGVVVVVVLLVKAWIDSSKEIEKNRRMEELQDQQESIFLFNQAISKRMVTVLAALLLQNDNSMTIEQALDLAQSLYNQVEAVQDE